MKVAIFEHVDIMTWGKNRAGLANSLESWAWFVPRGIIPNAAWDLDEGVSRASVLGF